MTSLVVDASVLVAALADSGSDGQWAVSLVGRYLLAAPCIVRIEAANVLRRLEAQGTITPRFSAAALRDLLDLAIELFPFEAIADRTWQLRHNLTTYDASYVAVAEWIDAPLATLDRKLSRASGSRCTMLLPD